MRAAVLLVLVLGGCAADLPVRYEVCDARGRDCTLQARFDTFEHCEFLRKYSGALCDSATRPGFAECDFTQKSDVSSTRCTR